MLALLASSLAFHPTTAPHRPLPTAAPTVASLRPAVWRVPSARMTTASEIIELGVSADTFLPQFLWLAIVAFPRSPITEKVMGPILPLIALSLIHVTIVLLAATKPGGTEPILIFADVFDPAQSQLDGMARLFEVRDFVAEEWPHGACAKLPPAAAPAAAAPLVV